VIYDTDISDQRVEFSCIQ